jgi:hypothetical protein
MSEEAQSAPAVAGRSEQVLWQRSWVSGHLRLLRWASWAGSFFR